MSDLCSMRFVSAINKNQGQEGKQNREEYICKICVLSSYLNLFLNVQWWYTQAT